MPQPRRTAAERAIDERIASLPSDHGELVDALRAEDVTEELLQRAAASGDPVLAEVAADELVERQPQPDNSAVEEHIAELVATGDPLVTAVALAMSEAGQVTKSGVNVDQGYKFASAEAILAAVRMPLLSRGVLLTAQPTDYIVEGITSRNNAKGEKITVVVDFTFRNGAGEVLTIAGWRGIGQDYGDKAIGKAYTSAIKTFVRTTWLLPTEHDDPEGSSAGEAVEPRTALPPWALEASSASKASMVNTLALLMGEEAAKDFGRQMKAAFGIVPDIVPSAVNAIVAKYMRHDFADITMRRHTIEKANAAAVEKAEAAAAEQAAVAAAGAQDAAAEQPDAEPDPTAPPRAEGPPSIDDAIREATHDELTTAAANHDDPNVRKMACDELERRIEQARADLEQEPASAPDGPPDRPPADADGPDDGPAPGSVKVGPLPNNPATAIGALRAAGCICDDPLMAKSQSGSFDSRCPIEGHAIPF